MTIDEEARVAVCQAVDDMKDELVQCVSDLVKIPSINPSYLGVNVAEVLGGETRNNKVLEKYLIDMGFNTEMWEIIPQRANLAGTRKGTGNGQSLILFGHIDTVPQGNLDRWSDPPFSGVVADGKIWGRGAMDQKGLLVAGLYAIKAIDRAKVRVQGDLIFLSTIGEETGEGGAEGVTAGGIASALDRGYVADAAICTDPAPWIAITQPHALWLRITVTGKSAHAMFRRDVVHPGGLGTGVAVSAIDKGMKIYSALRELERQWGRTKQHPLLPPGHFSLGPNVIRGGPSDIQTPFLIPDTFTIDYCIWAHPDDDVKDIKQEIESCIMATASWDDWMKDHPPKLEWKLWWTAYTTPEEHPIIASASSAIEAVSGKPATIGAMWAVTDCAFVAAKGIPAICLGVELSDDMMTGHAENEFIRIETLMTMTKVNAMAILDWCGYKKK
jgi:acetylornithine deacetylase/succinyl-diaminopimelate desuccinylase family protein